MTELVKYQSQQSVVRTMDEAERAAGAMAASGFFSDTKQAAQALVKILAGQEMGFGPFAAMTGVHVIQGKPSIGANLMAAAVKRSGRYDYRVTRLDDSGCEVVFFDGGREVGRSSFTAEDAEKAQVGGKDNWKKFPRNMYFARAMSNGVRWYCPDVFGGTTAYTPDELGAIEDVDGHIIDVPAKPQPTHQDAPVTTAPPEPEAEPAAQTPSPVQAAPAKTGRPYPPEQTKARIQQRLQTAKPAQRTGAASPGQRGLVAAKLEECWPGDPAAKDKRHSVMGYLIGKTGTSDMTIAEGSALLDWLLDGAAAEGTYDLHPAAPQEAQAILRLTLIEAGQDVLPL